MSDMEVALKIFILWFVGMFLLSVGINLLTKTEHRKTLKELATEHIRMALVIGTVSALVAALYWLLFEVV